MNQISDLFDRDNSVISKLLKNFFEESELVRDSVEARNATTAAAGKIYQVEYYRLEAVLAVGYRVRSSRGTQLGQWATQQLREFFTQGFIMDDERMKNPDQSVYFERVLERIRDIRSSEKVFWRKVCDIYATSIDYDPKADTSEKFFAIIENKMHWAAHGQTAAEVIFNRLDARVSRPKAIPPRQRVMEACSVRGHADASSTLLQGADLRRILVPGWSSLPLLDPGLIPAIPAGIKRRTVCDPILRGIALKPKWSINSIETCSISNRVKWTNTSRMPSGKSNKSQSPDRSPADEDDVGRVSGQDARTTVCCETQQPHFHCSLTTAHQ
ncbi:MAG: RhuM family protein [Luteolibacter sp.]